MGHIQAFKNGPKEQSGGSNDVVRVVSFYGKAYHTPNLWTTATKNEMLICKFMKNQVIKIRVLKSISTDNIAGLFSLLDYG